MIPAEILVNYRETDAGKAREIILATCAQCSAWISLMYDAQDDERELEGEQEWILNTICDILEELEQNARRLKDDPYAAPSPDNRLSEDGERRREQARKDRLYPS